MLHTKLLLLQPDVITIGLPQFVVNSFHMAKLDNSKIDLSKIDSKLQNALMPFQKEGVYFGIDKNGRCLIADDMGLGKTFQALAIADYYRDDWPILIVTTSSTKNIWEETIHKFLPSVSIMDTQYMVSTKDYIGDTRILITSHDMMTRALSKLVEKRFGIIIIDESHVLKNFKAKCTKAAIELCKIARRVILLSGTPALSRPSELYSQLSLIDHKFFGSFYEYSKRYCDAKATKFGWDATGKSNLQELELILSKHFMIRRTKDEVLKSLPEKKRQVVTLDVDLKQLKEDEQIHFNTLASKCNKLKMGPDKQGALLLFFAETSKIKIPSVRNVIATVFGVCEDHQGGWSRCILVRSNRPLSSFCAMVIGLGEALMGRLAST
ncbi:SWI/SNF-related matrix-associated actin-dependent regulator of chromatin subfamily A-like protein 1 [Agrilus planipennis]|uniref:SWI/SNF-related matrix-associated actin-dependent regulator of chromatin subfamily A-like protein 1 n=1 Tax=Agrilus planipennis TaxID=224129 RepID=A0A7F5RIV7_AGRPL|nr:SWI/SNF-related matrix-associated actin-dependent regulator of chromatin subfamily A-like protein 1 [Agrilus planipennis]